MDVSENSGTPKSSILTGFSIINHPFWGTTVSGNTYMGRKSFGQIFARKMKHSYWDYLVGGFNYPVANICSSNRSIFPRIGRDEKKNNHETITQDSSGQFNINPSPECFGHFGARIPLLKLPCLDSSCGIIMKA